MCKLAAGERALIVGGMRSGWSARSVAARFTSVSRKDISRHMSGCVNEQESEEA